MASLLKVIKAELDYEAKKVEYKKEEERTLARLGMNGHFSNFIEENSRAAEEQIEAIEGDVSDIEIVDKVGSKNGHSKKAQTQRDNTVLSNKTKNAGGSELKKQQISTSTSNLIKRKPEASRKDSPEKVSSVEKSSSKQQTLSSFFAGSSQLKA